MVAFLPNLAGETVTQLLEVRTLGFSYENVEKRGRKVIGGFPAGL